MKALCVLMLLFGLSGQAMASDYFCTEWTQKRGVSCVFASDRADVWVRQCENPCWYNPQTRRGNMGADCDKERVCHPENPKTFQSKCSKWVRHHGVTCSNPNSDRWEDKWVRACTNGLSERWCSDSDPNNNHNL